MPTSGSSTLIQRASMDAFTPTRAGRFGTQSSRHTGSAVAPTVRTELNPPPCQAGPNVDQTWKTRWIHDGWTLDLGRMLGKQVVFRSFSLLCVCLDGGQKWAGCGPVVGSGPVLVVLACFSVGQRWSKDWTDVGRTWDALFGCGSDVGNRLALVRTFVGFPCMNVGQTMTAPTHPAR